MVSIVPYTEKSDIEAAERISQRFDILKKFMGSVVAGGCRSLIVSGAAGLGKSFEVEEALKANDNPMGYQIVKGYAKAPSIFRLLYLYRGKNDVLVFDDCDSVFMDETSLNLIKAVCDTTEERKVSYLVDGGIKDEGGDRIPSTFTFEGSVVFLTNLDFDKLIQQKHKNAEHFKAMISRSHYIDLFLKTSRDYLIRIHQVVALGMLDKQLNNDEEKINDVIKFIDNNYENMRELSLRTAIKLADVRKMNDWETVARVTLLKM